MTDSTREDGKSIERRELVRRLRAQAAWEASCHRERTAELIREAARFIDHQQAGVCRRCKGAGTVADYVGDDMRCIETECPDCRGGTLPAQAGEAVPDAEWEFNDRRVLVSMDPDEGVGYAILDKEGGKYGAGRYVFAEQPVQALHELLNAIASSSDRELEELRAEVASQREHIRKQAEDIMTLGALCYDASNPPVLWKARCEEASRELANECERRDDIINCEVHLREAAEASPSTARAALEPFAKFAEHIARERPGWDHDDFTFAGPLSETKITMGDFRRARAALTSGDGHGR